jgi:hypothetical protein
VDDINPTDHPISSPSIIAYNSTYNPNDFARNGTQKGIMQILVGVARDPDQIGNVNMNLTLRNTDGTWNYTINTTFNSSTDSDLWINFDTNLVPDGQYKTNISAFSYTNPADYRSFLTKPNFTINNTPTLDTCGSIVANGTTYLVANVTSVTTCINVLYDNVTLDCGGNSITFGTGYLPSETFGVKALDRINITVKNCFVYAGILGGSTNGTGFMGISYRNVTSGRIENNTIITNNYYGYGIDLRGSRFNTIRGNKLFK